jgi:hypothetical protein
MGKTLELWVFAIIIIDIIAFVGDNAVDSLGNLIIISV